MNKNARPSRRQFLARSGAALSLAALGGLATAATEKRRNIVFILIDDQRFDAMSCMGHPFLHTPNLDRLARGGAHFKNAFVTTSLCAPSRASILSGQYAHRHGVLSNGPSLPQGTPTFPLELQRAGYDTAFIGKWHMGRATDEPRPGFDHWVSFPGQGVYTNPRFNVNGEHVKREGYITDLITDYAVDFLEQAHDKPYCLYVSHKAAHYDFIPAARHKGTYAEVPLLEPETMADTEANYEGKPGWVRAARDTVVGVDGMYWGQMDYGRFIRDYHETLLAVDDSVGRILDTLEAQGALDSTLILFTSDNGFLQGEHGLIDKRNMYEESIRVPMILHCPDLIDAGQTPQELVLNIDIAPTLLQAAGIATPNTMDGASFLPIALGEPTPWRQSFLYEYFWEEAFPQNPTVLGVRTQDWKYIWYHGIPGPNELYNLQEDPQEQHNLINTREARTTKRKLITELRRLMKNLDINQVPTW